jgi:hypothetical protein
MSVAQNKSRQPGNNLDFEQVKWSFRWKCLTWRRTNPSAVRRRRNGINRVIRTVGPTSIHDFAFLGKEAGHDAS